MRIKSFHAAVVDKLAALIVGGDASGEQQLPTEGELCARMGVSRTVLREAVKTLSAKGLVVTGPRIGTRAQPPSAWNLLDPDVIRWRLDAGVDQAFVRDILELRMAIEPEAAALAADRASVAHRAALMEAAEAMHKAVEKADGSYLDADLTFHESILIATGNPFFVALMPAVDALLRVSFRFSVKSRASAESSLPLHDAVVRAILNRDGESARTAIRVLIEGARQDIETDIARDDFLSPAVELTPLLSRKSA
jgi:DNA-binding FadR family transcriptional regulator